MNKILESSAVQERSVQPENQSQKVPGGRASYDSATNSNGQPNKPSSGESPLGVNRFNLPNFQPTARGSGPAGQVLPQANHSFFEKLQSNAKRKVQDTLSDRGALGSMLLLCGIVGCSAFGGYLLGQSRPASQSGFTIVPASFNAAATREEGKAVVGPADAQSAYMLKEMSNQLGSMRAELLRLHSVFVRLVQIAELDDGEFDLQSPLLDWKKQSSLQQLGLLNRRIAHMSDYSSTITQIFNTRRMAYDQKISGRPVVDGHRSSGFGYRTDPITGKRTEHQGLDYSGPVGEPILALADGVVTFSGKNSGYGNLVELEHVDGLRTRYAHNQLNLVSTGESVKKGTAIATLGSTGRSTGPHVHIEVRLDGNPIDPGFFIR